MQPISGVVAIFTSSTLELRPLDTNGAAVHGHSVKSPLANWEFYGYRAIGSRSNPSRCCTRLCFSRSQLGHSSKADTFKRHHQESISSPDPCIRENHRSFVSGLEQRLLPFTKPLILQSLHQQKSVRYLSVASDQPDHTASSFDSPQSFSLSHELERIGPP